MHQPDKQIYYRLTALWVICEALIGGVIHGLKLPVSGLFVGSSAVICICMLGYYYPVRGAILKATILVAIFKMMLSPQSPFPAYIAVLFQGLAGELIFLNRRSFKFNCFLLALIALIESGIQRLLMMTIIFGMDLWKAVDIFINGITGQQEITKYSYYIASFYILLHVIAGIIIGWYAGKIPEKIKNFPLGFQIKEEKYIAEFNGITQKKGRNRILLFVLLIVLAGIFIHSIFYPENAFIPNNMVIKLLLRSTIIVLVWITIINPILTSLLHRWLERRKTELNSDIREVILLLPITQFLFRESWRLSSSLKGIRRLSLFFKIVVFNSLRNHAK